MENNADHTEESRKEPQEEPDSRPQDEGEDEEEEVDDEREPDVVQVGETQPDGGEHEEQDDAGNNKDDINVDEKIDSNPDPVIVALLEMLEENLPNAKAEDIFKLVRRLQKVFDTVMTLPMEYFLAHTGITPQSEEYIDKVIREKKEYISLSEEKQLKTKKLEDSTVKLDLKREQYKLLTSLKLDDCMDRISRHNHLMSKK